MYVSGWPQAQFYLGFPLLLLLLRPAARGLFRRMAVTAGLVIAAVTTYRAAVALQFELPVPVFGPLDEPRMLELMTRTLRCACISIPITCLFSIATCVWSKIDWSLSVFYDCNRLAKRRACKSEGRAACSHAKKDSLAGYYFLAI